MVILWNSCAEILLDAVVPLSQLDDDDCSPLLYAINKDNCKLASYLIKRGADVRMECNFDGHLPLIWAIHTKNVSLIDEILNAGAEINARDGDGSTALHDACLYNHEDIIKLLLRKGADVCVVNNYGKTPFLLLQSGEDNFNQCMVIMTQEFSKVSFENLPIPEICICLILSNSELHKYFEKCKMELSQMKTTRFYASHSYYSVLKMSKNIKYLTKLTKNEQFVKKFEASLWSFSCFKNDLQGIFDEAILMRDNIKIIAMRLKSTFHGYLPDIVLRKLAENLILEDLPLE